MIRLTLIDSGPPAQLRLEGSLHDADVIELERACRLAAADGGPPRLDVSDLTYLDGAGAACLRRLQGEGATLVGCTDLVEEFLR